MVIAENRDQYSITLILSLKTTGRKAKPKFLCSYCLVFNVSLILTAKLVYITLQLDIQSHENYRQPYKKWNLWRK